MKRRFTKSTCLSALVLTSLLLVACSGSDPELADPEPETADDVGVDDEIVADAAEAEEADEPEAEEPDADEPEEAPEPEAEEPEEAAEPETGEEVEVPPTPVPTPELDAQAGDVTVSLSDGRVFTAATACSVNDSSATGWSFRFEGTSDDGVEIEGVYDAAQPDFTVLFLTGADALQGDDVFLSNINGGDDVVETSTGGTVWTAQVVLTTEAGAQVTADLAAACG